MANHLTPEELSKELGIDQQEVIRVCMQEGVPIYHGKIDKYLFQAQLQALGALPSTTSAAKTALRALARGRASTESHSDGVAFVFLGAVFAFCRRLRLRSCTSATLWRSASIRSMTGVSGAGSGRSIVSPASFASSIACRSRAVLVLEVVGSHSPTRLWMTCPASSSSGFFSSMRLDGLLDLRLRADVVGEEERLQRERVALRADEAEVLLAPEHELADRGHPGLLHRAEQQHVRAALRIGGRRREVVRPVEVHGVDVLERDEAEDLDRLRALERDRLEIGLLDDDELALRDLPALDELVRPRRRARAAGTTASA